jgi:hypothetical protein
MVREDVDDPVSINSIFVVAIRTVERCLVRRLTLGVVISGNHYQLYSLHRGKGAVLRFCNAIAHVSLATMTLGR